MNRKIVLFGTASAVLACTPAWAHGTIKSLGAFYSGLLHPFLVLAHGLAMAGTGLLLGQQRAAEVGKQYLVFLAAYFCGLVATLGGVGWSGASMAVVLVAAATGLLVATGLALPTLAAASVSAVSGGVLALDSAADGTSLEADVLLTLGTFIGGAVAVMAIAVVSRSASQRWHRIGIRVLGSWTAAASIMVLALAFSRLGHGEPG